LSFKQQLCIPINLTLYVGPYVPCIGYKHAYIFIRKCDSVKSVLISARVLHIFSELSYGTAWVLYRETCFTSKSAMWRDGDYSGLRGCIWRKDEEGKDRKKNVLEEN